MLDYYMNKLNQIYRKLLGKYRSQGWWPVNGKYYPGDYAHPKNEKERFEIIIGAILTQNTSWKNVEKALEELRSRGLLSRQKLKSTPVRGLSRYIKSSGYFNQKARKIKAMMRFLESGKEVNRENLLEVWGVGPETADSILLYAYKKPYFVVDAYTKRVLSRMGLCSTDISYDKLQDLIAGRIRKSVRTYNEFHALLVRHGKQVCTTKPGCGECVLKKLCDHGSKQ
jgi:endonuclease-3 related protein